MRALTLPKLEWFGECLVMKPMAASEKTGAEWRYVIGGRAASAVMVHSEPGRRAASFLAQFCRSCSRPEVPSPIPSHRPPSCWSHPTLYGLLLESCLASHRISEQFTPRRPDPHLVRPWRLRTSHCSPTTTSFFCRAITRRRAKHGNAARSLRRNNSRYEEGLQAQSIR